MNRTVIELAFKASYMRNQVFGLTPGVRLPVGSQGCSQGICGSSLDVLVSAFMNDVYAEFIEEEGRHEKKPGLVTDDHHLKLKTRFKTM